jgi:hypothetical protein
MENFNRRNSMKQQIEPHQWTNGGEYVLIVKCLNRDGTSYSGFVWPKAGPVKNDFWSREPTCSSGGLFGWPWGFFVADGRDPDALAPWLVFKARPENIIGNIEGPKCKAVPGENGELPEVVYYGTQAGAMRFTQDGRMALVVKNSEGKASTSGYSSSASTSGDRSIAAACGELVVLEPSARSIGAANADRLIWKVHKGAVLLCQWADPKKKDDQDKPRLFTKTFDSAKMRVKDGA